MTFVTTLNVQSLTLSLLLLSLSVVVADRSTTDSLTYNSTACSTPCRNGTYEVMSCSESHPKLCKGSSRQFIYYSSSLSISYRERDEL